MRNPSSTSHGLPTQTVQPGPNEPILPVKLDFVPAVSTEIGTPSLLRLFTPAIAEQVSWLLPLALVGLVVALCTTCPRWPLRRTHLALLLWGAWLLTAGFFFSVARFYHLYYLIMLAPAVAALAGIGTVALWNDYQKSIRPGQRAWWSGWLLPLILLATALIQAHTLAAYAFASGWPAWLAPLLVDALLLVAAALPVGQLGLRFLIAPDLLVGMGRRSALAFAAAGTFSLLVAPAAWAAASVAHGNGAAWLPQAGPGQGFGGSFGGPSFVGRPFAGRSGPASARFRSGFAPPGFRGFPGGRSGTPPSGRGQVNSTTAQPEPDS